jgi:peptide/nickel transport system permease protein
VTIPQVLGDLDEVSVDPISPENAVADTNRYRNPARLRLGHLLAMSWVVLVIVCAILAPLLPIADPNKAVTTQSIPPFHQWPEFLGTDQLGRSQLSRIIFGARVSLTVSVIAVAIGFVIGMTMGVLAAAYRWPDRVVGVITDATLAFPGIVLILALGAALGPGLKPLLIGLTIFAVPAVARLSRANAKVVVNREHVQAAQLAGAKPRRWLTREVLPSVVRPAIPYCLLLLAVLMVAEASVSFLGLGIRPPTPSWGSMISDGQPALSSESYQVFVPAAVLFLTVFCVTVVGRWLRAVVSPGQAKL